MSQMTVPTTNEKLVAWVEEIAALTKPKDVHWCDGSAEEYDSLCPAARRRRARSEARRRQAPELLPRALRPGRRRARRGPHVHLLARTRHDAGPTNNWTDPAEMREKLNGPVRRLHGGPHDVRRAVLDGPARLADRPHRRRAHRLGLRRREHADHDPHGPGRARRARRGRRVRPVRALGRHAAGRGRRGRRRGRATPTNKYIVHFPETREIWSFGSGYGGNALLGKKCFALRIASVMARDEGWMAEHMLILKLTSPEGEVKYVTGAFPSACGKTNLAMLIPTLEGWTVETIGDDIAWMKFGDDGKLYAINPEAGFFGVAPGTGEKTNPNAMETVAEQHAVRQLRADRRRRRLVGGHDRRRRPAHADRLEGQRLDARLRRRPPRTRTAASRRPASQDPAIAPEWEDPKGVAGRRDAVRWSPRDGRAARHRGARLGARRLPRRDDELGDDGRRRRRRRPAALRPVRDAAVLRLQHGRLLRALARRSASATARSCRRSSTSTGSARTDERPLPVAGLRRELARAEVGLRALRRHGRRGRRRRSASSRPRRDSTRRASTCPTPTSRPCCDVDLDALREQLPQIKRVPREVRRRPPGRDLRAARRARGAARAA